MIVFDILVVLMITVYLITLRFKRNVYILIINYDNDLNETIEAKVFKSKKKAVAYMEKLADEYRNNMNVLHKEIEVDKGYDYIDIRTCYDDYEAYFEVTEEIIV